MIYIIIGLILISIWYLIRGEPKKKQLLKKDVVIEKVCNKYILKDKRNEKIRQ